MNQEPRKLSGFRFDSQARPAGRLRQSVSLRSAQPPAFLEAFSLVEVTMAVGITAFCLLSVFGLLSVGMISNKTAIEQTAATGIATGIFADLRNTPKTNASSTQYRITFPATALPVYFSEDGSVQATAATARYLATITVNSVSPTALVNIRITWPAAAPVASGTFEVTTAIDRR